MAAIRTECRQILLYRSLLCHGRLHRNFCICIFLRYILRNFLLGRLILCVVLRYILRNFLLSRLILCVVLRCRLLILLRVTLRNILSVLLRVTLLSILSVLLRIALLSILSVLLRVTLLSIRLTVRLIRVVLRCSRRCGCASYKTVCGIVFSSCYTAYNKCH